MSLVDDENDHEDGGGISGFRKYSYRHYLVEVRFEGHEQSSSAEIIIRTEHGHSEQFPPDHYVGDHHGLDRGGNNRSLPKKKSLLICTL